MGISETIVAAIIGALATMVTAIFQLLRNRPSSETRPKKSRTRSLLATIALMIGCIVGGYAWSALRAVSAKEDLKATMQEEFSRQFAEFAARQNAPAAAATSSEPASAAALAARTRTAGAAEAVAHLPPCRIESHPDEVGPVTCTERNVQPIALCATIPAAAQAAKVRVLARVPKSESAWEERSAGETTLGSLRTAAATTEQPVDPDLRSVCLEVSNSSVDDTLAVRMIVEYSFASAQPGELTAAAPAQAL